MPVHTFTDCEESIPIFLNRDNTHYAEDKIFTVRDKYPKSQHPVSSARNAGRNDPVHNPFQARPVA